MEQPFSSLDFLPLAREVNRVLSAWEVGRLEKDEIFSEQESLQTIDLRGKNSRHTQMLALLGAYLRRSCHCSEVYLDVLAVLIISNAVQYDAAMHREADPDPEIKVRYLAELIFKSIS